LKNEYKKFALLLIALLLILNYIPFLSNKTFAIVKESTDDVRAMESSVSSTNNKEGLNANKQTINNSKEAKSIITNRAESVTTATYTVRAADSSATPNYIYVNLKPSDAPYSIQLDQETLSTLSGGLSLKESVFTLPGRNGLSFSLIRSFDSSMAKQGMGVYGDSSYSNESTGVPDPFYLGAGWTWNIPYLEFGSSLDPPYIHLPDGGVYKGLTGYPWKDLTFITTPDSMGRYYLKTIQNITYTFNSLGKLITISDEFNNQINFSYYDSSADYPSVHTIKQISDSIGNTINFSYPNTTTVIVSKGNQQVTYSKINVNGISVLSQEIDAVGRVTTYDYSINSAKFNLLGLTPNTDFLHVLLTGVTHPTGAKTVYTYEDEPVTRYIHSNIGGGIYRGVTQAFRVKSREEQVFYTDGTTQIYNHKNISYTGDMGSADNSDIPSFSTTINDGVSQITSYNKKHYINDQTPDVFYNYQIVAVSNDKNGITYTNTTDYSYDETRFLPVPNTTKITKAASNTSQTYVTTSSKTYDDYGNVTQSTDELGITTTNTYDANHLIVSTSKPIYTGQTQYTLFIRDSTHPTKIVSQKVYDGSQAGTLLTETDYENIDSSTGNVGQIRVKNGTANDTLTQIEYSASYQYAFPTKTTTTVHDVDGNVQTIINSFEYDSSNGKLTKYTDGKSGITSYQYDALDRVTFVTHPDNSTVNIQYDDLNNFIRITDETGVQSYTKWNPIGLKIAVGINEQLIQATYHYDSYGRMDWSQDARGNQTRYGYDQWSRQNTITYPDGAISTFFFDDINNVNVSTDPEGYTVRNFLDAAGRTIRTEETKVVNGVTKTNTLSTIVLDNLGKARSITDNVAPQNTTIFGYDVLGRLTSVKNAKNELTKYQYNPIGKLTVVTYPDNNTEVKTYDEIGRLIQRKDPKGNIEKAYYDANNNRIGLKDRNGTSFKNTYDSRNMLRQSDILDASGNPIPSETILFTYDLAGRRTSMTDSTGTTSYSYDPIQGVLSKVIYPDGRTLQYGYDAQGNLTNLNDPFGSNVYYSYDSRNRLKTVGPTLQDHDVTYSYFNNNLLRQIQQVNGITSNFTYDGLRVGTLTEKKADGSVINTYGYSYDNNGNQLTKTENGTNFSFTYDPLNRIATSSQFGETFVYDTRGNRTSMTSNNLFESPDGTYTYDKRNRLSAVVTKDGRAVTYRYNGDGLLYERTENGQTTRYYYNGDQLIAEGVVNGSTTKLKARYIRGNGLVAREDATGKAYYLHNGHGDVVGLADGNGTMLNSYSYDIWGNIVNQQETIPQPFKYSGEMWDNTTGLQYLRARWYDPSMGRFINEDTDEGQIDNPLSLNLYTYVRNNPLRLIDPSGHKDEEVSSLSELGPIPRTGAAGEGGGASDGPIEVGKSSGPSYEEVQAEAARIKEEVDAEIEAEAAAEAERVDSSLTRSSNKAEGTGKASKYEDITSPTSRYHNRGTDVTRQEFEKNLVEEGWTKSVSKDGKVVIYEKEGARYVIREDAKSTGGPTADYYKPGSNKIDTKIRLGQ
jgi:RHS repeat-associated protein